MASESFKVREVILNGWKYFALPVLFFTITFIVLTYPLILSFETHFFTDDGDGLMGVWNLWWVERVVTHPIEYSTFWHTDMLHQPFGITLLGHTLTPFNGLLASLLTRFMPLLEAHNLIVIFSFVMSGLTAYWLGYYFSRSVFGSLFAGWLFTFSAYHFTHFDGHLNLITLVIISDFKYDEISGYDFCMQIRETANYLDIPFIFITDSSTDSAVVNQLKSVSNSAVVDAQDVSHIANTIEKMLP